MPIDINWKVDWFAGHPKSYWNSIDNCRIFLDEVAHKRNIKKPSDWGKITQEEIIDLGGRSFLAQYSGSLIAGLQSVYKGI